MEIKEIADRLEALNRNLGDFRKANDDNAAHIKEYGTKHGDHEQKLVVIGSEVATMAAQIAELKRTAVTGTGREGSLTQEQLEQKSALGKYLKKGDSARFSDAEVKALSTLSNPDGGYLITADTTGRIMEKVQLSSPVRQYAAKQTVSTDALEGRIDNDEADAGWVGEVAARPETDTPQLGMWRIPVHEMYAKPKATQKMVDDAVVDVEAWLQKKVGEKFGRIEAVAFISGDGVGKPKGILSQTLGYTADASRAWGTVQKIKTGVNGAFAAAPNGGDALINAITALHSKYRAGALFFCNRYTLGEIMKLKDSDGKYLWMPDFTQGGSGLLKGFTIDASFDHMPDIANDSLSLGFGNLSEAYQIVDRQGIRVLRDPYSSKPFIEYYSTYRVGGDVLNSEAYKLIEFKA